MTAKDDLVHNDRTEKLLAMLLIQNLKGATQADKALHLSIAGFTNVEIGDLLQTNPAVIAQNLYAERKKKKKKAK